MTRSIHQRSSFVSEISVLYMKTEETSSNLFKDNLDFSPSSECVLTVIMSGTLHIHQRKLDKLEIDKNICTLFSSHVIGVMIKFLKTDNNKLKVLTLQYRS